MPLFYFDVRSPHGMEPDETGIEFESVEVAYLEACRAIPDLIVEVARLGDVPEGYSFEIADEAGRVVWHIPFIEPLGAKGSPR